MTSDRDRQEQPTMTTPPDPNPVPPTGPACPHCGGGPLVRVPGTSLTACQSCARAVGVNR